MNLRALQARLRKLEKQSGLNDANETFGKMTDQEIEAAVAVYDLLFDEPDAHEEAIQAIMEILNCKEHIAATFLKYLQSINVDGAEFKNLSDEELVAEVVRLEMEIEEHREAMAG